MYASPTPSVREQIWNYIVDFVRELIWNYIVDFSSTVQIPWILTGNFNQILMPNKVEGGLFRLSGASKFVDVLSTCGLLDLGSIGLNFTWASHTRGRDFIQKQLDHVVANIRWRQAFPKAFVETLCCRHFDHSHLLMRCGGVAGVRGIRPFRFLVAWTTRREYDLVVSNAWRDGSGGVLESLDRVRSDSLIFQ